MKLTKELLLILLLNSQMTWAGALEIFCPTPADIKAGNFNGWLPLYQANEELVSDVDVNKIRNHVYAFKMAHWKTIYLESAHCFYIGDDEILGRIIFARDAWRPSGEGWIWINSKSAECTVSTSQCGFNG